MTTPRLPFKASVDIENRCSAMDRVSLLLFISFLLGACVPRTMNMAIHNGDPVAVQEHLNAGTNPDGADAVIPYLHSAVRSHKPDREQVIRALLMAGADPNMRSHGHTPLHMAASAEAVNSLIEYGADATLRTEQGALPADSIEKNLIMQRSAREKSREEFYWTPSLDALQERHINHLEAALEALGRTPITEDQAWDKYPQMMASMYPGGATPPSQATGSTNPGAQPAPIGNNSGRYLSPYTSDGVVAEWVNKAINNQMGSAAGSAVGGAAGAYAANKALESVPGGSLIGGFLGSKAGKAVGTKMADDVSGGDTYRRQTSDLSFHSLRDMATWLREEHGDKANFAEVSKAANAVYPGLLDAISGQ